MSINQIYGVYDEASECYVQYLPSLNDRVAEMTFQKMFKEKRLNVPLLYDYPNLFKVNHLGTFDDNSGIFENASQQKLLLDFGSLVAEPCAVS